MTLPQQKLKPEVPQKVSSRFWWMIFVGLMVWNIVHHWPKAAPEITIPYSIFLDQTRAGNVAKVQILGDKISGSFVKPLMWPQKKPAAESATPSKTKPENVSSPGTAAPPTILHGLDNVLRLPLEVNAFAAVS